MPESKTRSEGSPPKKELWIKCTACQKILYQKVLEENLFVCPECRTHLRLTAWQWVGILTDDKNLKTFSPRLAALDPLGFKDTQPYIQRLKASQKKTRLSDAMLAGEGTIGEIRVTLIILDFEFMGGSMGSAVGEEIRRAIDHSISQKIPLIGLWASGGARMQEGIFSLMQMAKISSSISRLHKKRLPYLSVLTNPTTGGVTASIATLGDILIAEPGALVAFAGPRVIEETLHQKLPKEFQRAEFLLSHGMVDLVVERKDLRKTLLRLLSLLHRKNASPSPPEGEGEVS